MLAEPKATALDTILKQVYSLYSDYVLKNAFYELDMPIQCDLFNQKLDVLVNGK